MNSNERIRWNLQPPWTPSNFCRVPITVLSQFERKCTRTERLKRLSGVSDQSCNLEKRCDSECQRCLRGLSTASCTFEVVRSVLTLASPREHVNSTNNSFPSVQAASCSCHQHREIGSLCRRRVRIDLQENLFSSGTDSATCAVSVELRPSQVFTTLLPSA